MSKHTLLATSLCLVLALLGSGAAVAQQGPTLVPIPTPVNKVTQPSDPSHFTFVVGGDNRPPGHGDPMPPSLAEICREIGWIRPDFVIWTGDAIEGYDDTPAEAAGEYDAFLASAALCDSPIYSIPGNHEIATDPRLADVYQQKMGALYGSFDYGNSHFIGIDTSPVENGVVNSPDIDDAQWKWLESDLAAHAGKSANIFVFFHHYMFGPPDPDNPNGPDTGFKTTAIRDRLHQLFVKYGVRAVFNGHAHLYYHVVKDGIDYFIAGNGGAPMDAPPEQGGYLGYMIVNVDGDKITTEELPAWDLQVRPLSGGDGISNTASVAVDNSEFSSLTLRGISLVMPAGPTYAVSAAASYKGGMKPEDASIVSQVASADGKTVTVTLETHAAHARTTILTVAPAPAAAVK